MYANPYGLESSERVPVNTDDTIVAVSTPAGRGGIGIVRLSGPDVLRIAQNVLRAPRIGIREPEEASLDLAPWRTRYAEFPDEKGELIDRVLVTYFQKPHSYTAEDVVEVSCHGSPVVLEFLMRRCLESGARLAEPGEFTMRAFLNGRIDLTQAEAVRDLIDAQTLYQAKVAASQIEGSVSRRIAPAKKRLVDLIALLEAGIDFAEDDVSVASSAEIALRIETVRADLSALAQSFATGNLIHRGLTLAIVGRPNVGKSSLFNCLLEQDRAIVTATPGTTRDLVAETVEIDGVPLRFVDTAGVRQAYDEAESIGVRKSFEAAAESDLALLVLNGAEEIAPEDFDLLTRLRAQAKLLVVINKCDLPQRLDYSALREQLSCSEFEAPVHNVPVVRVSAMMRQGIDELRRAIIQTALPSLHGQRESQFLTNVRQERLVRESLQALDAARSALEAGLPHEILLMNLYDALRPLDAITGATTVEDILSNIFSNFCIGK